MAADPFLEQIETELRTIAKKQRGQFHRMYGGSCVVPGGGTGQIEIQIDGDGDFLVHHLAGLAAGPTDANGRPGGVSAFGGATATRGLQVSITDRGSGRNLTNVLSMWPCCLPLATAPGKTIKARSWAPSFLGATSSSVQP